MYKVETTDFADSDLLAASQWYEQQTTGLGAKFLDDVENLLKYLETYTAMFRKIQANVHQAPLRIFPYVVLYKIKGKTVFVLAVFNCYQSPNKKMKRRK